MKNILGRKVGMTSVFTDDGRYVPVTVIEAGPCTVVERRTKEKHGYEAVALGFGAVKKSRVTRALAGHFKKQGVEPARYVREFRNDIDGVEVGQTVTVAGFEPGDRVDVVGISKGHGFAGGIKRHNFQRRRREPRLDDPPSARLERRHQRRTRRSKAPPSGSLRRRSHDACRISKSFAPMPSAICCSCAARFRARRTRSSIVRKSVKPKAAEA